MRKIFENKMFQGIMQGLAIALLIGILKIGYNINLNVNKQVLVDSIQNMNTKSIARQLDAKIEVLNKEQDEKNKNTQMRLDKNADKSNEILLKLNNIEQFIKYKYNYELTNN